MKKLAIKGHATRGKEVIEILEMLGGKISNECGYEDGFTIQYAFFIDTNENSFIDGFVLCDKNSAGFSIFTLEEFLEKFPYKVGDKVIVSETQKIVTIEGMSWRNEICEVVYETCYNNDCVAFYSAIELQNYEEFISEQIFTIWKKYSLPEGYEFHDDKGNVINTSTIELVKKQPEYPKTYEECHELMVQWKEYDCNPNSELILCESPIHDFCKLIVARNIYWKIAGEQMGLGKSWKQDYDDRCFIIANNNGNIHTYEYHGSNNVILAFPTAEMRDAFYENFKDLIEECKVFL